jgi:hypothetical protein
MVYNIAFFVEIFQIASAIAVILALVYAVRNYNRGKQLEQVKLINDTLKDLYRIEEKLIDVPNHKYPHLAKRLWDSIYLNELDWLSFLVNKKQITNKKFIAYFINSIKTDYEKRIFQKYATKEEKEDDEAYSDLKDLYKKTFTTKKEGLKHKLQRVIIKR